MTPNEESAPAPDHDEEPPRLPDEAVVVRGGESSARTLHKSALDHHDKRGDFAISVASLPDMSADDLAVVAQIPHPKIRETTVGVIRHAGYNVVRDEPPEGHALITLPRLPADTDFVTIADLLGPTRVNPATGQGGTDV
jgi:hypothetical protein